jgi:ABC-type transporter Mla subunit MlaD
MSRVLFVRVGLLLVVGIAAIIGMVLFLTRSQVTNGAHYETYFRESVQGLDVGAPVKYLGVTLGQVTGIGLVSAAYTRDQPADIRRQANRLVFVRFVIDPTRVGRVPTTETAIRAGLRTRLASQGLTGLAYLELSFADPNRYPAQEVPWTPQYELIPSMPSTIRTLQDEVEALLGKLNDIDFAGLTAALKGVTDDLHAQLTTGDVHRILASAADLLTTLQDDVKRSDLPGLAAEVKSTVVATRGMVQSKQTRQLLAAATQAAERFSDAAAKLPALIASLQATVKRANDSTADVTADLAPILRDAQGVVANLRDTTETLRRYPASVLLGGPPPRGTAPP